MIKTKYTICVKSNSPELLDKIYFQVNDSFFKDDRKSIINCTEENNNIDDANFFKINILDNTIFKPFIMYGFYQDLKQFLPKNHLTEVMITCNDMTDSDVLNDIATHIHNQFIGIKDYIDNNIIINVNHNIITISFCNCCYYPIIGVIS